jgi:hypothetical protein
MKDSMLTSSLSNKNISYTVASLTSNYYADFAFSYRPFVMFFLQDEEVKTIERRVFNLIDCFTKIGGMMGLVATICTVFTSSI